MFADVEFRRREGDVAAGAMALHPQAGLSDDPVGAARDQAAAVGDAIAGLETDVLEGQRAVSAELSKSGDWCGLTIVS